MLPTAAVSDDEDDLLTEKAVKPRRATPAKRASRKATPVRVSTQEETVNAEEAGHDLLQMSSRPSPTEERIAAESPSPTTTPKASVKQPIRLSVGLEGLSPTVRSMYEIEVPPSSPFPMEPEMEEPAKKLKGKQAMFPPVTTTDNTPVEPALQNNQEGGEDKAAMEAVDGQTILESEHFTMISVDELPSQRDRLSSPAPIAKEAPNEKAAKSEPYFTRPAESPGYRTVIGAKRSSVPPNFLNYTTPFSQDNVASSPPALDAPKVTPQKPSTPKLVNVVKTGIALQGVVATPADRARGRLDNLFSGFSDGTRRELQAGLRLGEVLRQQMQDAESTQEANWQSNSASSSANIVYPRLPTPDDKDDNVTAESPANSSTSLASHTQPQQEPLSPARSEDAMSWQQHTPPTTEEEDNVPLQAVPIQQQAPLELRWQQQRDEVIRQAEAVGAKKLIEISEDDEEQAQDGIWEEADGKSPEVVVAPVEAVQPQGEESSYIDVPKRGKLSRTWRRRSSRTFRYSDEAVTPGTTPVRSAVPQSVEETQEDEPEDHAEELESGDSLTPDDATGDANLALDDEDQESPSERDVVSPLSDDSGDTGMFFHSNLPSLYRRPIRHHTPEKENEASKLDLSLLLGGSPLIKDSPVKGACPEKSTLEPSVFERSPLKESPLKHTTSERLTPFKNKPLFAPGLLFTPSKGSPLCREVVRSPTPEDDEPSDGEVSLDGLTPDEEEKDLESQLEDEEDAIQRQLREEMEQTSLEDVQQSIGEVHQSYTEESRPVATIPINFGDDTTDSIRTPHSGSPVRPSPSPMQSRRLFAPLQVEPISSPLSMALTASSPTQSSPAQRSASSSQPAKDDLKNDQPKGLFTRLTSYLFTSNPAPPVAAVPQHPLTTDYNALPKVEPWTKTHYKTLDRLYQDLKRFPDSFDPSLRENATLLNAKAQGANIGKYYGVKISNWGYDHTMTSPDLVVCGVFCQLLALESAEAYESLTGARIEQGSASMEGKQGEAITEWTVVKKYFSIVVGEQVRRDERRGVRIDRSKKFEVQWP